MKGFAVAVSLTLAPTASLALDLTWSAPPPCPDRASALARLDAASDTSRRLAARASFTRDVRGGGWALRLETDDGAVTSERELTAPSCGELADAAVLLVALALDTVDADVPAAPPQRPSSEVVARGVRVGAHTRGGLRASVGVALGVLPAPSLTASLRAWIARGRWRVEVLAARAWTQTVTLGDGASASLDASLVGLRVCRTLTRPPFELSACGGADVGLLQGRGAGVARPAEGAATATSLTAGTTLAWRPVRHVAAVASVDGAWAFDRPRFVILGVGEVFSPAPVGLAASLGAEVSW